ncbi:hypothetical protein [Kineococcus arenarius]|uniref:hypothetical protein n=1 Tax=unclassified Kineococcus TaxID=2621656 RepID=UPI003D7DEA2E
MPDQPDHTSSRRADGGDSVDDSLDDPVTELLLDAFEHEVRTRPVDERRLTIGTHVRLQHRRRVRRSQVTAAALLVVAAVPVTVQAWPTSTTSTTPAGVPESGASTTRVTDDLPDMSRARAAVPAGQTLVNDFEAAGGETPLTGLGVGCTMGSPSPRRSVAGWEYEWINQAQPSSQRGAVNLAVTAWPTGEGVVVFDAATTGSGTCRFTEGLQPLPITIDGADQAWAARTDSSPGFPVGTYSQVSGVVRVGDLLVCASLRNLDTDGTTELTAVLSAAVADLRAARHD